MNALSSLQALGLNLSVIPPLFPGCTSDPVVGETFSSFAEHEAAISEIQRFRGRVYVADGAIPASALDEDGRHYQEFDLENYHLCFRDSAGRIRGGLRLRLHEPGVETQDLKVYELIERMPGSLAVVCDHALVSLFEQSRAEGVRIGEVGGWAIDEKLRRCRVSATLPLAGWALYQVVGNACVFASATTRHLSSEILKRLGGFSLKNGGQELPRFTDDYHGCEMELLGFDSRRPHPKYADVVAELKAFLLTQVHEPLAERWHPQTQGSSAPFPGRSEPAFV